MSFSENQLDFDEEVIGILQDHWITMATPVFMYISVWLLFFLFLFMTDLIKIISPNVGFFTLGFSFFILLAGHHLFFIYIIEYLVSSIVITNKRLIEIHFFPFFVDDISYIEIDKIHEIDKIKHGFLHNLLNYGEVCINVLRKREAIIFKNVRYPGKFINIIKAIKANKELKKGDMKYMGASCPEKYQYLLQ